MTVLSQIPTTVTREQVTACLEGESRLFGKAIDRAVSRANALIRPAAALKMASVISKSPGSVTVRTAPAGAGRPGPAVTLETGLQSDIWHPAREILVSVMTIGPLLDRKICELNRSRDDLGAYLLDCAGVAALRQAGAAVCRLAEKEARRRQWGVGGLVGPGGTEGWPLEDQQQVCKLVPLDEIGVKLDGPGCLYPLKTVSGLIPMGPGYKEKTVGSTCRHCCRRETCSISGDRFKRKSSGNKRT